MFPHLTITPIQRLCESGAIQEADFHLQACRDLESIAVADKRIPVTASADAAFNTEWPVRVTACEWLNLDTCGLRGKRLKFFVFQELDVQVFFGYANISRPPYTGRHMVK